LLLRRRGLLLLLLLLLAVLLLVLAVLLLLLLLAVLLLLLRRRLLAVLLLLGQRGRVLWPGALDRPQPPCGAAASRAGRVQRWEGGGWRTARGLSASRAAACRAARAAAPRRAAARANAPPPRLRCMAGGYPPIGAFFEASRRLSGGLLWAGVDRDQLPPFAMV
jgi:hypothetical protein